MEQSEIVLFRSPPAGGAGSKFHYLDFGHEIFHRLISPLPLAPARIGWGSLLNHSNIILGSLNELKMKEKTRTDTKRYQKIRAPPQQYKYIDFRPRN